MATYYSNSAKRERAAANSITSAETLTASDVGEHYLSGAGATVTLPSLPTDGKELYFRFTVVAAFATTPWIVASAEGDNINGTLIVNGASVAAAGEDQINFVESAENIGDFIELRSDATNSQWIVSGVGQAAGSITATDPA